ncbi:MAG: NADP-dependent phosphogluconate dehydrogenase, partial [Fimbriimonadaceae bacterium]|nr:NADP-dependent phosphogluconate dehydrogenase [Fimbriimonadaceae bacterium]
MTAFGVIGLGRIGGGLAGQAAAKGFRVVGLDPGPAPTPDGAERATDLGDLVGRLTGPRIILLYVPAGRAVDETLDGLLPHLEPGDLVIDGGNSYWGDSLARHARLAEAGLRFMDLGTSGGVIGAETGACFMAGGTDEAFELARPILEALSVPGGLVHAGGPGCGHFVKLVHNGIEFGMMQAIGEGLALMTASHLQPRIPETLEAWRHGSIVRSHLIDLLAEAAADRDLESVSSHIEDTGEVNWLVQDAVQMEVPIPAISLAVSELFRSRAQE